ncbi:hypothetical protein NPIL_392141 [Nephila pilipes]|uniref:Uncharacterized protein n=1 Tax=Nephila pilipes TaxID=299642 RepID=A0A8X6TC86_NEPPI|nr:hypothetical protein NPIL_392141 [Nephila pilipes]
MLFRKFPISKNRCVCEKADVWLEKNGHFGTRRSSRHARQQLRTAPLLPGCFAAGTGYIKTRCASAKTAAVPANTYAPALYPASCVTGGLLYRHTAAVRCCTAAYIPLCHSYAPPVPARTYQPRKNALRSAANEEYGGSIQALCTINVS